MTNRTIQFLGQGYAPTGTDPITITATMSGNTVYSGTIPTLYTSDVGRLATDQVVLFTFEVPMNFSGTVPMSISLDSPVGVDAYFEQILSNYMPTSYANANATGNVTVVSSGPTGFLNIAGATLDPRSNVVINGVAQTRGDTPAGTWGWEVEFAAEESGTIDCDLTFTPGLA